MNSDEYDWLKEAAGSLLGIKPTAVLPVGRGANSSVYKVETGDAAFALKRFPPPRADTRPRIATEWRALSFLRQHGLSQVPAPIARDESVGLMAMEWLEGSLIERPLPSDLTALMDFVGDVFRCSDADQANGFDSDVEACISATRMLGQIFDRLALLQSAPDVAPLVSSVILPELTRLNDDPELRSTPDLPRSHQRLVVADLGFHNALRRADGRVAFFDLDSFGWDDPVKTVADFLLHPRTDLLAEQREYFLRGVASIAPNPASFLRRLQSHSMLYGVRWSLILLNPFRPGDRNSPPDEDAHRILLEQRADSIKSTMRKATELATMAKAAARQSALSYAG